MSDELEEGTVTQSEQEIPAKKPSIFSRFFKGLYNLVTFKWLFGHKKNKEAEEEEANTPKQEPKVEKVSDEELKEAQDKGKSQESQAPEKDESEKKTPSKSSDKSKDNKDKEEENAEENQPGA